MKMISVLVIVTSYLLTVQGQSNLQCTTPAGKVGQCILLIDCPQLLALARKKQKTPEEENLFRYSKQQCASDTSIIYYSRTPNVCCEVNNTSEEDRSCFTPDWIEGTCVDLQTCPTLLNRIKEENRNYLQNFKCEGPTDNSVCCGPPKNLNVRPLKTCNLTAAPPDPRTECCGIDSSSGNKIYGGNITAIDQFPWLALLEYKKTGRTKEYNEVRIICGGVLISGRYVLTAKHCTNVHTFGNPKKVLLGEFDVKIDGKDCVDVDGGGRDCTDGVTVVPIEKIINHPQNDITVIRLQFNAPYSDFIRPICLPTSDIALSKPPLMLQSAGWGRVSESELFSNVKRFVELPYKTLEECQTAFSQRWPAQLQWKGYICAGGEAGKDTCNGDSGGPLMSLNNGIYTVVGILSFGVKPCGQKGVPAFYINVYEYLPWIRRQMKP